MDKDIKQHSAVPGSDTLSLSLDLSKLAFTCPPESFDLVSPCCPDASAFRRSTIVHHILWILATAAMWDCNTEIQFHYFSLLVSCGHLLVSSASDAHMSHACTHRYTKTHKCIHTYMFIHILILIGISHILKLSCRIRKKKDRNIKPVMYMWKTLE